MVSNDMGNFPSVPGFPEPDPQTPKKLMLVGDYDGEVICFNSCKIWNEQTKKWDDVSPNDPRAKAAQKNWTICGDFICNQQGQHVAFAPPEVIGLSEDVTVEFMIAGAVARGGKIIFVLGDPKWWNSGRYFRIGFGRKGGERVFRAAGNWFGKHWHWDV